MRPLLRVISKQSVSNNLSEFGQKKGITKPTTEQDRLSLFCASRCPSRKAEAPDQ